MSVGEYNPSQLRTRAHNPILHHSPLLRYRSLALPAAHSRSTFSNNNASGVRAATQPRAAELSRNLTGGLIERGLHGLKTKTLWVLRCPEAGAAPATTAGRIPAPSAAQIVPASSREQQQRRSRAGIRTGAAANCCRCPNIQTINATSTVDAAPVMSPTTAPNQTLIDDTCTTQPCSCSI